MAGGSFSLTEKLAVTGAFLALVAVAVGTEDDPGVVVTSQDTVKDLRAAQPVGLAAPQATNQLPQSDPLPAGEDLKVATDAAAPLSQNNAEASHPDYDPDLGRVPLDFTNGPPDS